MEKSNAQLFQQLQERPKEEFDIEHVDDEDDHIEMVRCSF